MVSIQHLYDGQLEVFQPFQQGKLSILESDSINIIKFKYRCPQGSILGPFLFLIYINDIVNSGNVLSLLLFADDITVYGQNDSIGSAI